MKTCFISRTNKIVDIKLSAHDAFLGDAQNGKIGKPNNLKAIKLNSCYIFKLYTYIAT